MHIVCPHCRTSYAINLAALGPAGRNVRCSRCKEVWLARSEDAMEEAAAAIMAEVGQAVDQPDAADDWSSQAGDEAGQHAPMVDSPSIASDWPAEGEAGQVHEDDWSAAARRDADQEEFSVAGRRSWLARLWPKQAPGFLPRRSLLNLPTACAAMGALVAALIIWRADVVRLLPQTATFYRLAGLEVNLRGLAFRDIKLTREAVDGKPVLVIEGVIVGVTKKPVGIPRLRFSVRDEQGTEIYAWNAVLEQSTLQPGERAAFKSRLASPPPEGRQIDIRFFNRRDIAGSA
ncbi:MAG: zinc-ribbon domain-containing protein [Bradyrhizobium sp.]|uniref:MJ0042-type zinc finger domain-containing protein n=1 Tax=Bradyrhizobium sp. TaxID=376 RepID=UPI0025C4FC48|nr:MJ0042-type zinc finger domain-containing protein [Bradyrhizobium sp.]MBI5261979.1 zinc-ribbon domain-containing protein [Bradyrhizobium sp.]